MQVERTTAGIGRVQVYLPGLTHRIRLDKMALVMHMKAMICSKVLQICDEGCDVNNSHVLAPCSGAPACHV